ncbi:hypothetical protein Leryth_024972, partial [Lithospermum erythrorhizon]
NQYLTPCRGIPDKVLPSCSFDHHISSKHGIGQVLSGLAASILIVSQANVAVATEHPNQNNICQLANASDGLPTLPIDNDDKEGADDDDDDERDDYKKLRIQSNDSLKMV